MRLYANKIPDIASACSRALLAAGDIESENPREVDADIASVLSQYLAAERDVNEKTKDLLERTGRGQSDYSRVRQQVAESNGIKVGDDALDYLLDQIISMLHHSANVDEIYVDDVDMRRKVRDVLRKQVFVDDDLDAEVRSQIRNIPEGGRVWDIEYARVLEQVKRRRGLV